MLWVKICGMTRTEDALAAAEAGADAVGFIFAPSKRRIEPEAARDIIRRLPKTVEKVGVFADESAARIQEITQEAGLTAVQLHGDESPGFARELFLRGGKEVRTQLRVFKTLHVSPGLESVAREFLLSSCVDGVLLDSVIQNPESGGTVRGGTGQTFDWHGTAEILTSVRGKTRVIVAGGLSPENVGEAIRVFQPWGVDVCSGVEIEPGRKDLAKVRAFVAAARAARN